MERGERGIHRPSVRTTSRAVRGLLESLHLHHCQYLSRVLVVWWLEHPSVVPRLRRKDPPPAES